VEEDEQEYKHVRRYSAKRVERCGIMNAHCRYQPLDLDDWCEHDPKHYYGPDADGKCFDLSELVRHVESQLLSPKYGNPYPSDPFSREPFTVAELEIIVQSAIANGVVIPPVLNRFVTFLLRHPELDGQNFTTDTMHLSSTR